MLSPGQGTDSDEGPPGAPAAVIHNKRAVNQNSRPDQDGAEAMAFRLRSLILLLARGGGSPVLV